MAARKKATPRRKPRKAAKRKPGSTTQTRRKPAKGSTGGAPKVEFDLDDLTELAAKGNTNETIARLLKVSKATLQRRIADTPEVADAIANGRASMEDDLRTWQLSSAKGGNATMQIWLGKQNLGQRDVRAVELTGGSGGPLEIDHGLRPALEAKLAEFIRSRRRTAET